LFAVLTFFFTINGTAQDYDTLVVRDLQLWTGIKLEKTLFKKLTIGLEEEIRLRHNFTMLEQFFTNVTATYKINKHFRFGAHYRFIMQNDNIGFSSFHRIGVFGKASVNLHRLRLDYKLAYQSKDDTFIGSENGETPRHVLRNKIKLKYKLDKSKVRPYCSFETFTRFIKDEGSETNKLRFGLGTTIPVNERSSFNLGYRLEIKLREAKSNQFTSICAINYTHKFKSKKIEK
ncbi:DUF2490 domain-containing protein, partial [Crocinitomix catalasitica]|nr:DUF2490 domain-containing protein [Crocinitomix catalasitica]